MRFSNARVWATLLAAQLFSLAPAHSAIIYSQTTPEEPIAAFSSLDLVGFQKIADNFRLQGTGSETIRSLSFIGAPTNTANPFVVNNFRVTFFEDDGGVPGTLLAGGDFEVGDAFRKSPTGGSLFNGIPDGLSVPIEYAIDLGLGVILDTNTEYWVSISNDFGGNGGWIWARANGVLDQNTAATSSDFDPGLWTVFQNGGMFFELDNQNIPEPSSGISLVSVLISFLILFQYSRLRHAST